MRCRHLDQGDPFDLLFTDIVMPGRLDGIALARVFRAHHPDAPILFTSDFASPSAVVPAIRELGAELVTKRYQADLAARLRRVLDRGPPITS